MESILNIDEELVNSCVQTLTLNTLQTCQNSGAISWQEVELAVHLVYLYGELQKGVKGILINVACVASYLTRVFSQAYRNSYKSHRSWPGS